MTSSKVTLSVNGSPVDIVEFVQEFIQQVVSGMLSTLKGIGDIHSAHLACDGDEVVISVNGAIVPSNQFVNRFIGNTVNGMVGSLKGVEQIDRLEIDIAD